ncbi:FecR family protein [Pedobacter frigiditerrae]|uniref:FecR family protein n=1 Tax=Pedobacter frigiditerrae TaxID=2530452 RepID=UPI00293193AA|nr:FecR domain-containing protein [Pedobacter frigiditerrae]
MKNPRLSYLFHQYYEGIASKEEELEFVRLVESLEDTTALEDLMQDKWQLPRTHKWTFDQLTKDRMFEQISDKSGMNKKMVSSSRPMWQKIAGIAAVIAIVSASALLYDYNLNEKITPSVAIASPIVPGSNQAVLTLADGKKIVLNTVKNGEIAAQAGISVSKTKDGNLVYHVDDDKGIETISYNTVQTPKGGQYTINLPDGTIVTLNAESSLRFPTSFASSHERKVELIGEGYFEVAKNKQKPFIVNSSNQEVKVLGTHFNIKSYADERSVKTTLLEGAVAVNNSTILKPGEQAILLDRKVMVREVNADSEVAWKNGKLSFTGNDFKSIMRSIARWYNVEVVYDYHPETLRISGGISKFENIKDVLDLIQETGDVKFKIEGRRVHVIR